MYVLFLLGLFSIIISAAEVFYGLNYGINTQACPTLEQVKADFVKIQQYTGRVRIFSLGPCHLGQLAVEAVNALDMRLYLGMWIDRPDTFAAEMQAMRDILASGQTLANVDGLIVGSEVLYRNDTDANTLAGYLAKVRTLVSPLPITNADVYYEFPPVVVDQLDFLMMNAFPYWEGVTADQGALTLMDHYRTVVAKAQGKPVRISETGWPSAGGHFGASVASPENQKLYLAQVLCQTRQHTIDLLWFSAFDEPYKPGVEQHWGIMNSDRTLKTSLSPLQALGCGSTIE
ncbi:glycoside hydrolase superfamily [Sporodiniella umbellata]|nr:glycoside hydrolase superfamily [Sporodiniella umbellata]